MNKLTRYVYKCIISYEYIVAYNIWNKMFCLKIYASVNFVITESENGLVRGRCQTITYTNADLFNLTFDKGIRRKSNFSKKQFHKNPL